MAAHGLTNYTVEELTDYSVAAFDSMGKYDIPEGIIPQKNSQKDQGTFRLYDVDAFKSNIFAAIADNQYAPSSTWGHTNEPYIVSPSGLRDRVSDRDVINAGNTAIDLFRDTAMFLARNSIKSRNVAFATAFLTAGEWTSEPIGQNAAVTDGVFDQALNAGAGGFQRWDQAASDPLATLDALMDAMQLATELRPDTLIIPRVVMTKLKRNAQISQYGIQNPGNGIAGGELATINIIAQYTGLEASRIHVLDASYNAATQTTTNASLADLENGNTGKKIALDSTAVPTWIAGKNVLLFHAGDTSLGLRSMTACAEFVWTGLYPAGEKGNYKIKTRYDEDGEFTWVEARTAFKFQIVAAALGILLVGVIA